MERMPATLLVMMDVVVSINSTSSMLPEYQHQLLERAGVLVVVKGYHACIPGFGESGPYDTMGNKQSCRRTSHSVTTASIGLSTSGALMICVNTYNTVVGCFSDAGSSLTGHPAI